MKKSLIALAALAATGAFAQSSVTISGLLDVSVYSLSGSAATASIKGQSVSTRIGSATSAINFNVLEDLGGGLKAQAFVALDPRDFVNDAAAIARHEAYVGVSGNFGNLRMGAINTGSLSVSGVGGPLGTATGSGYSQDLAVGSAIRFGRAIRYDTPVFNGFGVNLLVAPGNSDHGGTTPAAAAAGGLIPQAQQVVDLGVSYNNGPLSIAASSLQRGAVTGAGATASQVKSSYNSVAANFTAGAAKLFAGYGRGTNSSQAVSTAGLPLAPVQTTGGLDTTLARVGGTYTMGAWTLLAQYTTAEIGADTRKITGLRADYALSKRSAAYGVYESFDTGAASNSKINTLAVGVRHSF